MKDFASFEGPQPQSPKTQEEWMAEAQELMGKFHGRSEADLLRAIYARAVEGKKNGTLTNEQIDEFYRQFSPVLDHAKRKRLQKVVEQLKKM